VRGSWLQAFRTDGLATGIFYPPTDLTGDAADAGLFIARLDDPEVFGFPVTSSPALSPYTAVTQNPTTGSGTAADPLTQVTTYTAGAFAQVKQTTTYVNGAQEFLVRWEVKNASASAPLHLKAMVAADFYFDGSDRGTGIFTAGPPRFIGGTNADTGNSGGFVEVLSTSPPWSHYQALEFGGAAHQVWGKIAASASSTGPSFDDTVIGDQVDNAGGWSWTSSRPAPASIRAPARPSR
jgi:hypothetical protein